MIFSYYKQLKTSSGFDAKLIVLLNNHISTAQWCCPSDEGLWYTDEYPEEMWIQGSASLVLCPRKSPKKGLELLTERYLGNPWVAGMDLRNEIRPEHDLGATYDYDYNGIDDNSHLYYL